MAMSFDAGDVHASYGALVVAARAGDRDAIPELVRRLTPTLWRVARSHRLDTDTCQDIIQNTWLAFAEHMHTIRDPQSVAAWLMMTARRSCLAELRRTRRVDLSEIDGVEPPETAPRPDQEVCDADRDRRLWRAISRLPERDRLLLSLLVATPPPPYTQIAEICEMPVGSIGPTRARCLQRLRRELRSEGWDDPALLAN